MNQIATQYKKERGREGVEREKEEEREREGRERRERERQREGIYIKKHNLNISDVVYEAGFCKNDLSLLLFHECYFPLKLVFHIIIFLQHFSFSILNIPLYTSAFSN